MRGYRGGGTPLWLFFWGGSTHVTHGVRRVTIETLASLKCREGELWDFTDQTDIPCAKREAPLGVRRVV